MLQNNDLLPVNRGCGSWKYENS